MTSAALKLCPLCDQIAQVGHTGDVARVYCERCGTFVVSETAQFVLEANQSIKGRRFLLSGLTRRASENRSPLRITSDDFDDLLRIPPEPRTPFDAIDRFLLAVHDRALDVRGMASFDYSKDYPLLFVRDEGMAKWVADTSASLGWIAISMEGNNRVHTLTLSGWRRLEELRAVGASSHQAFVAMSFHSDLDAARTDGFLPALQDAGYRPMILTAHEHNGLIDDVIISEIRRSGLLVADFTRHVAGAYFEAGFAMGLGIPVIRTCQEADFDRMHFDVNHYNVVRWNAPGDLREKLLRRVLATVPVRK